MGQPSKDDVSVIEDDSLDWSKELALVEPYLQQAPFEELCGDDVMVSASPSVRHIDFIFIEQPDLTLFHPPSFPSLPLISIYFISS